jgi:hypothetical protein
METREQIGKLEEAINSISALEPSVPDHVFDEAEHTNSVRSGAQNTVHASGGNNISASGGNNLSGNQFTGPIGTLNFGKQ